MEQNRSIDDIMKDEKKAKQMMYRIMLQNQITTANKMKMQGTMTHVEKKMNKPDLRAYKEYKVENYGMIPGINNKNKVHQSPKKETVKMSKDE